MPLVSLLSALWVGEPRSRPGFRVGSVAAFDVDVAAAGGARLLWLRARSETDKFAQWISGQASTK